MRNASNRQSEGSERWALKLDFVGARADARPEGQEETGATFSYFKGRRSEWQAGLKSYSEIVYRDLWPGIDLVYAGTVNRMKYTFAVKPGADPNQIKLAWRGASGVALNAAGELAVTTPAGGFTDERPVSWQVADGRQVEVATKYQLAALGKPRRGQAAGAAVAYGFAVGKYDRSRELVIDPAVLVYAGFLGGSGFEGGNGIAVDSAGNAYVVGTAFSAETDFPVTAGPDVTPNGGIEAFVAKVNASGTALVYAGYIGGSGSDQGNGIAVDGAGNAYVTGRTTSNETSLPVTVGPDLTFNSDFSFQPDAFVAKVNAAGTALDYCGYIGGGAGDQGHAIAVDGAGNAYVGGTTTSPETSFPVTVGPDLTFNGGFNDGFVAKVNASGTALDYAGYIGGAGGITQGSGEHVYGIAVDGAGNAYITGEADSNEASFPVTVGPDLIYSGGTEGFVAKVAASGMALDYCGYIGGTGGETSTSVAVDGTGNAYVTGFTSSDESSFPVMVGPDLTLSGFGDAYVAKVNASGTALLYAGYIGGSNGEVGNGIAVDGAGNAYVTGFTTSDETSFPVTGGPNLTFRGGDDAFVAKVDASGTALVYSGYIGGNGDDVGSGIAVDSAGNAYVTGSTSSDETSFPATGGPDLTANGSGDAFVAKISFVPPNSAPEARCRNLTVPAGPSCTASVSIDNGSFDPDGADTITLAQSPAGPYALGPTGVTLTVTDNHGAASSCTGTVTVVDTTAPAISCPAAITANGSQASGGAVVPFTVSATDSCDASPTIVAAPPSGSFLPFGTTTVLATATDDSGNSTQCSFTVTVRTPQGQIAALLAQVEALGLAPKIEKDLIQNLDKALQELQKSNPNTGKVIRELEKFIRDVQQERGDGISVAAADALIAAAQQIIAQLGG